MAPIDESAARKTFKERFEEYGLQERDLGRKIRFRGDTLEIIGLVIEDPDGPLLLKNLKSGELSLMSIESLNILFKR